MCTVINVGIVNVDKLQQYLSAEEYDYLISHKQFLDDFIYYYWNFNQWKAEGSDCKCEFCGNVPTTSHKKWLQRRRVNGISRLLCPKCLAQMFNHQRVFDRGVKYILLPDKVKLVFTGKSKTLIFRTAYISYCDLEFFFYQRWNMRKGYIAHAKLATGFHRLILGLNKGNQHKQSELVVDHIDRNPSNNVRSNLRLCTNSENMRNSLNDNFIGVTFHHGKYEARLSYNGKTIYVGCSKDLEVAKRKRLEAEKKYFGEYAPQRHWFEQYGIDSINDSREDNSLSLKNIIEYYMLDKFGIL